MPDWICKEGGVSGDATGVQDLVWEEGGCAYHADHSLLLIAEAAVLALPDGRVHAWYRSHGDGCVKTV